MRRILLGAAACSILFVSNSIAQSTTNIRENIRILSTTSDEPKPVVVWASGCSGFFHPRVPWHYVERAQTLLSSDYAVAFVDYVAAFGLESACDGELSLPAIGAALREAVSSLDGSQNIDPNQVILLGSSLGGGGVLAALAQAGALQGRLRGVLAIYPSCEGLEPWSVDAPVWIWFAGNDQIQPPARCRSALDSADGRIIEKTFPGVHHGFDSRGLPTEPVPGQAALAYDEEAAEMLWGEIASVLENIR